MKHELPPGFTQRAATTDDAQAVTLLLAQCDLADYGAADTSLDDVLDYWRREGFQIDRDAWLVYAPDGTLAACGMLWDVVGKYVRVEPSTNVLPAYRERGLEECNIEHVEEWTCQHASKKIVHWVVDSKQTANVARFEARGYKEVRHSLVMEIRMQEPPPRPVVPKGITIRSFELGRDERPVHACIQEAFRDVWGHVADKAFEPWWAGYGEHKAWSPRVSCVVMDGDEVAAAAMAFNFTNGGWIRQLGVRRPWRKTGIGLAMLQRIFGDFYAQGVRAVGLGVDASSLTGATRLYQRAGMSVKDDYAQYEKDLKC